MTDIEEITNMIERAEFFQRHGDRGLQLRARRFILDFHKELRFLDLENEIACKQFAQRYIERYEIELMQATPYVIAHPNRTGYYGRTK